MAATASTTGTARGTMQGSWRPRTARVSFSPPGQAHAVLRPGDGGGGLEGRPEHQGQAGGDAPQHAPRPVGGGGHPAALHAVGIVVLRAPEAGGAEAGPELHPLDGGDSKQGGGQAAVRPAEHPAPQSGGHALDDTLHRAAHRVPRLPGLLDQPAHLLPCPLLQHGEGSPGQGVQGPGVLPQFPEGAVLRLPDAPDVGGDLHPRRSKIWRQTPPATHRGAVSRPEKWPPPRTS